MSVRIVTTSPAPAGACVTEGGRLGDLWRGGSGSRGEVEAGADGRAAMSGLGFGDVDMDGSEGGEVLDKIDMSLDDIIRMNRAQQRRLNTRYYPYANGRFRPGGSRWGFQQQRGYGRGRYGYRWRIMPGRRRPYRVKTGLAAWKASNFREGVSPLSRLPLSERSMQRPMYKRSITPPRSPEWRKPLPGLQWPLPRRDNLSSAMSYSGSTMSYNGYKLEEQRENRQATFLSRRGLEVQTQMETDLHLDQPSDIRPCPWRTSSTSEGILTVSIENPAALELTINSAPRLNRPILPPFLIKDPSQQKAPKGVALQFDINSIGKQTGITLNERFRILKEQRITLSPSKGTRFVTVG
ncbi:UAP56-interacting factor isoform X2 [Lissotriton helveticus]